MDKMEAQFIVRSARPEGQDAWDPAVAEAMAIVRNDPELSAWLDAERAFDRAMAAKLSEVCPPATLKAEIVAGFRVQRKPGFHAWTTGFAIAASLAAAALVGWWVRDQVRPSGLAVAESAIYEPLLDAAVAQLSAGPELQLIDSDLAVLRSWIRDHQGPLPSALPGRLDAARGIGCKVFAFQGRQATLICLRVEGGVVHLVVLEPSQPDGREAVETPRFVDFGRWHAAMWDDRAGLRFVLLTDGPQELLNRALAG